MLLACMACAAMFTAADQIAVRVQHDPSLRDTNYSVTKGTCRISWVVYASELNKNVIHQHARCNLPLPEQMPLISGIMSKLLESAPGLGMYRTLSWGRLYPDGQPDPTLAMRLMLAAKRSAMWDASRGRPRTGDVNGFVRKLANEALIYPELRAAFRQAGLDVEIVSIEKVLVLPAGRLPFFDRLPGSEIRAADKLPFDCQIWFSISR
mgnify:CR=1 FL=1